MEDETEESAGGPLEGLRVLDFSTVLAGPLCSQILGDLGAEVVKVEPPQGDATRAFGAPKGGLSAFFAQVNRNKRSLVLDLKRESAREVARGLARGSDVVIVSLRPGVAERLGLGYEALASENPDLVYAAITGFGSEGPYAEQPAYDTVIQGLAGFMRVQGHGEAEMVASAVADKTTGLTCAYGILGALLARARGRGGQRLEVPMLDSWAAFILPDCLGRQTFVPEDPDLPVFDVSRVHRTWRTADGEVVVILIQDAHFQGLCRILERPDLAEDPRYANIGGRIAHLDALFAELEAAMARWPTAELVERARRHQVPLAPANGIEDFLEDPQAKANGIFVDCDDREAGRLRLLRSPVRFGGGEAGLRRPPPRLGADGEEVLREAGYDEEALAALRRDGALG